MNKHEMKCAICDCLQARMSCKSSTKAQILHAFFLQMLYFCLFCLRLCVILCALVCFGSPKYFKKVRISPSAAMKMVSPPMGLV